jgi:hypothetical protein
MWKESIGRRGGWDEVVVARERKRWQRNEEGVIGG